MVLAAVLVLDQRGFQTGLLIELVKVGLVPRDFVGMVVLVAVLVQTKTKGELKVKMEKGQSDVRLLHVPRQCASVQEFRESR